jgi:hypothetical protein
LGTSERFLIEGMKTMIESMVKEMLKTKDYERPKSRKALDRKGKRDFNLGKAQKCQKLMSKGHE